MTTTNLRIAGPNGTGESNQSSATSAADRPTDNPPTINIVPWPDPILDRVGHDPRSRYVERFWLPTLGPTALLLLRHLADRFDEDPDGLTLPVAATNHALGFGPKDGRSSPVVRQLDRLAQFHLTCGDGAGTIAVRRHVPPINPKHVKRLPPLLRKAHAHWTEHRLDDGPLETARRSALRLASALVDQGDDDRVEQVLGAAGFHPAIAGEAARLALATSKGIAGTPSLLLDREQQDDEARRGPVEDEWQCQQ